MHLDNFKLSAKGKLLVAMSFAYLSTNAVAGNIEAANSKTAVSQQKGVDIVNIAAPNAQGLSHNQYNKFNVSKAGAVLNNSRVAGQSQLAGQLQANKNLRDKAATVILNEVVSKNPSLIHGKQEVFGMAADYVLANPNGITVKDSGFINTNRASLVVGRPEIAGGRLAKLNATNNSATLDVQGKLDGAAVLDLVAPKVVIGANGNVKATKAINAVSGSNKVVLNDNEAVDVVEVTELKGGKTTRTVKKRVLETRPVRRYVTKNVTETVNVAAPVLDGQVFGSMNAGSIRIHSTDAKASQEIRGTLTASKELSTDVAGNLNVRTAKLSADTMNLKAKNTTVDGVVTDKVDRNTSNSGTGRMVAAYSHAENGVKFSESDNARSQTFEGSTINATNSVNFENTGNLNVKGSKIKAGSLTVNATNVNVDGQITRNQSSSTSNKSKLSWYNNSSVSDSSEKFHATEIQVREGAKVNAKGKVDLKATQLNAGTTVSINGAQGVKLHGDVTRTTHDTSISFKNETKVGHNKQLKTGHAKKDYNLESLHATQINAGGDVVVESAQALESLGAKVHAGGNLLTKVKAVKLDTVSTTDRSNNDDKFRYFGGAREGLNRLVDQTLHGSSFVAGKQAVIEAKSGVTVRGSTVQGTEGALVNAGAGRANISHVNATDRLENRNRIGTIFNITKSLDHTQSLEQTAVGSTLRSNANLTVKSDREINVIGSKILAARDIQLAPKTGNVNISAATTNSQYTTNTFAITPYGTANATAGNVTNASGKVGIGLTITKSQQNSNVRQNTGSNVQAGGNLDISSNNNVNVQGSTIGAGNNVNVTAKNINVTAAQNSNVTTNSTRVTDIGIGASVSANNGTPKVTVTAGITSGKTTTNSAVNTAQASAVNGGNVNLTATNNITHQGTNINATGNVTQSAKNVINNAAQGSSSTSTTESKGGIQLELSASANKALSAKATIHGSGGTTNSNTTSQTGGTVNAGGNVNVNAANTATDVGTKYNAKGDVNINAANYVNTAAVNTANSVSNKGGAELSVGASTSDFATIDVNVAGKVNYNHAKANSTTSAQGALNGNNVNVNAANTATIAANINAKNNVNVTAANGVTLASSNNTSNSVSGGFGLGANVGIKVIPEAGVAAPSAVGVNANVSYARQDATQATGSNVTAGRDVNVNGGSSVALQGTNVTAGNNVNIAGNKVTSNAALKTNNQVGVHTSAGVNLGLGSSEDPIKSFNVEADVDVANSRENTYTANNITAGNKVNVAGNSTGAGVSLNGTNISGAAVNLTNPKGTVENNTVHSSNSNFNLGVGVNVGGELQIERWTEQEIRTWLDACGYPHVSVTDKEQIRKIWNLTGGGRLKVGGGGGGGNEGGRIKITPPPTVDTPIVDVPVDPKPQPPVSQVPGNPPVVELPVAEVPPVSQVPGNPPVVELPVAEVPEVNKVPNNPPFVDLPIGKAKQDAYGEEHTLATEEDYE